MSSSDREWAAFLKREVEQSALVIIDDPGEHICVHECYLPDAELIMTENLTEERNREVLRSALETTGERQVWYIINYWQAQLGYEQISKILDDMNYKIDAEPAANYTIKYKNLEIYRVEKK